MTDSIEAIPGGHLTTPAGFLAGAVSAGIKTKAGALDLAILYSERDCSVGGVFTTNLVRSAPVDVTEARIATGSMRGLVANSGCANAPFGGKGTSDAEEMAELAAKQVGVAPESFGVSSTGVTGVLMPMDKVRAGLRQIAPTREGGPAFARAIMTTDTRPKEVAFAVKTDGGAYTIGGCAKGSGMIHPNMATMLCYVTTDAAVEPSFLRGAVRETADATLNMVTVDGDTSCSDTFLVFANGAAGGPAITAGTPAAETFRRALLAGCTHLARELARDGEGAQHLIEVEVTHAASLQDARLMARTVALSSLVKTAVAGRDPNWGRILVAAGRSGARIDTKTVRLGVQGETLFDQGSALPFSETELRARLAADEVSIEIDLGLGNWAAKAWGCDLTTDYVHINADYRT